MTARICAVDGCTRPHRSNGYCTTHSVRLWYGRDLDAPIQRRRPNGSPFARDEAGNKECGRCLRWRPETEFHRASRRRDGLGLFCKECYRDETLARHGLTRQRFESLLVAQHGGCATCGATSPGGQGNQWHVDHDHHCCPGRRSCGGCVRGLLCSSCNVALGHVKDDPSLLRRLADYLERTSVGEGDES